VFCADGSNIKVISKDSKTFVQNDAAVYYKRTGLQTIAQEAGVLPGPSGVRNVRKDSSVCKFELCTLHTV
jgi:hypothetical protein